MKVSRELLLIFFLFSSIQIFSQLDSISKPVFKRLTGLFYSHLENHLAEDTLLNEHFNYFAKDFNGNLAQPSQEIVLENREFDPLGFRFFRPNYRSHILTEKDILFHKNQKPYTKVFGLAGMRQEQILRLVHSKNIRRINYSVIFNRYKSVGFYKYQLAAVDNLISTLSYETKNQRYSLNYWFLFNKLRHQENGGLKNPADFDSLFRENKELLMVNLQSAKRTTRNLNTGLVQFIGLNKTMDSTRSRHQLFHKFQFNSDYYVFSDQNPESGFFPLIIYDSIRTKDSSIISKFRNSLGYLFNDKNSGWNANIHYTNEITTLKQSYSLQGVSSFQYIDTTFMNHILCAGVFRDKDFSKTKFEAQYVAAGNNQNNYSFEIFHVQKFNTLKSNIELNFLNEKRNADGIYQNYRSNNHFWSMNLNPVTTTQAKFVLNVLSGKFYISNQTRLIDNYIWFNTPDVPLQSESTILIMRNSVGSKFNLGPFRWDNRLNYQYTNKEAIISVAPIYLQSLFFYDGILFSGNLHLQTGFQINYYSSFNSNAYMPSLNSYYTSARRNVGNYPFVDFFINAEIKPVRFFFLIDHANQGLTGSSYQLTPGFPMQDRSFKFGFTWLFWD